MYSYIKGLIVDIQSDHIVLENNGIGYLIYVSNPYAFSKGKEVVVYLYQQVKEDGILLYGFNLKEEKDLASETKKPKEEKKDIDLDKTNENTFLTTTNLFTESDFDDFNDLKEEVAGTKIVIKILIVIVILAFIVGLVFVLNKFLNLGWF